MSCYSSFSANMIIFKYYLHTYTHPNLQDKFCFTALNTLFIRIFAFQSRFCLPLLIQHVILNTCETVKTLASSSIGVLPLKNIFCYLVLLMLVFSKSRIQHSAVWSDSHRRGGAWMRMAWSREKKEGGRNKGANMWSDGERKEVKIQVFLSDNGRMWKGSMRGLGVGGDSDRRRRRRRRGRVFLSPRLQ